MAVYRACCCKDRCARRIAVAAAQSAFKRRSYFSASWSEKRGKRDLRTAGARSAGRRGGSRRGRRRRLSDPGLVALTPDQHGAPPLLQLDPSSVKPPTDAAVASTFCRSDWKRQVIRAAL